MKTLPQARETLLVRTDFSDQAAWDAVRAAVAPIHATDVMADVEFLDDPAYQGLTPAQLLPLLPKGYGHPLLIVADKAALAVAELPLAVVDLKDEQGREVRIVASELWQIENNVSLANMDFDEFADAVDEDGVFRDF